MVGEFSFRGLCGGGKGGGLPFAYWSGHIDFECEVGERRDSHRVDELRLDAGEGLEGGWVRLRRLFGVLVIIRNVPGAIDVGEIENESRIGIVRVGGVEVFESFEVLFARADIIADFSAPKWALLDGF